MYLSFEKKLALIYSGLMSIFQPVRSTAQGVFYEQFSKKDQIMAKNSLHVVNLKKVSASFFSGQVVIDRIFYLGGKYVYRSYRKARSNVQLYNRPISY